MEHSRFFSLSYLQFEPTPDIADVLGERYDHGNLRVALYKCYPRQEGLIKAVLGDHNSLGGGFKYF